MLNTSLFRLHPVHAAVMRALIIRRPVNLTRENSVTTVIRARQQALASTIRAMALVACVPKLLVAFALAVRERDLAAVGAANTKFEKR